MSILYFLLYLNRTKLLQDRGQYPWPGADSCLPVSCESDGWLAGTQTWPSTVNVEGNGLTWLIITTCKS